MAFLKTLPYKMAWFFAPEAFSKKALRHLSNPLVVKPRPFEDEVIKSAKTSTRAFKNFTIAEYRWGFGPKKALLIHGWEGRAANFAALIPLLVDRGYTVIGFDAPSHGNSSKAPTSFFDYSELTAEYLNQGPFDLFVSHSFGSVPLTLALSQKPGYPVNHMFMVTTPDRFEDRVIQVVNMMGLPVRAKERLLDHFETVTQLPVRELGVAHYCKQLKPVRAVVLHGSSDKVLPQEWSERVAESIENAEFCIIEGIGHYRILWHPETQKRLIELIEAAS
jgi:pimeloyl-ACP methyl ester carboxylesterase